MDRYGYTDMEIHANKQVNRCRYVYKKKESEFAQSWLTLCNPMDCSLPGSFVHGIFQARGVGCVAISFSRGLSGPKDRTQVYCTAGRFFTI